MNERKKKSHELSTEQEKYQPSTEPSNFFRVLNLTFPLCPVFHPECFQSAFAYRPESDDVILTSYPKCDTKVIEAILWKLLYPQSDLPELDNLTNRYIPCVEMVGLRKALSLTKGISQPKDIQGQSRHRPRFVKTYLPLTLVPFYSRAKYVYVVRSPWDACVAYYRFLKLIVEDSAEESFDTFFEKFLVGEQLPYGDFFEHVSVWQKYKEYSNVLILSYEQVKSNPRGALFVIAAFLGERYIDDLVRPDEEDAANAILKLACPDMDLKRMNGRKGNTWSKEGKEKCSEEQMKMIDEKVHALLGNTGVEHLWTGLLKKDR